MEEDNNSPWGVIFIATTFSLIILGIAYFFISPAESPFFSTEKTEKIAEFKNARVTGRKEGKKRWELFAEEGWTSKRHEITHLKNIKEGKIYQDGELVVTDLVAPTGKTYRQSEIVETFGPVRAYLELGKMSKSREKDKEEWSKLTADYLKHTPKEKRSEIKDNVTLHKKDSTIFSDTIIVDHDQRIAEISGNITLKRKDGVLQTSTLKYLSRKEKLIAENPIELKVKEGSLKTNLKCNKASFFTDIKKDMTLQGNIEVAQVKKLMVGDTGVYSEKKKRLELEGAVKVVFEKADVILKEKSAQKLKNPDAQKILKEKTILTSDKFVFSTKTGDASASGSVFVFQKGREAKGNQAEYNEEKETLTLTGNAYMKKGTATPAGGQEWVKCKKIVVKVQDESFEAFGEVEAEFKL